MNTDDSFSPMYSRSLDKLGDDDRDSPQHNQDILVRSEQCQVGWQELLQSEPYLIATADHGSPRVRHHLPVQDLVGEPLFRAFCDPIGVGEHLL